MVHVKEKICTSVNGRQGPWMNWGESMLCYHCVCTNVEGMPRVAMRIQATIVQQGADVCAEPEPWQGSPSWHQTQEFIHTPLLKGDAKVTPGQWSCLNDNYCFCFQKLYISNYYKSEICYFMMASHKIKCVIANIIQCYVMKGNKWRFWGIIRN